MIVIAILSLHQLSFLMTDKTTILVSSDSILIEMFCQAQEEAPTTIDGQIKGLMPVSEGAKLQ